MSRTNKATFTHSLIFRNTVWYILNLLLIIIIIGSGVLMSTSYFLVNNIKQDTNSLQHLLIKVSKGKHIDWDEKLDDILYPDFGYFYVKITNSKGKIVAESHGWNQIVGTDYSEVSNDWFRDLIFHRSNGVFYTQSTPWKHLNGEKEKITIIAELTHIGQLIIILIKVLIGSTILGVLLGSILIYFVTKKSIKPLKDLTYTVSEINGFSDFKKRVIIPKGTYELTKLGEAFNTLLIKIDEQFEKERAFVSNASHELRTPITAFKGHINLLKRWGKKDPKVLDQSIQVLENESGRMERLIKQLLILARTDSPYVKKEPINLYQVIKEAEQELITGMNQSRDITFQTTGNVLVYGNADQIKQVAIILIENAMKYTNANGKIDLCIESQQDWGIFRVKDTGIGIEPQELPFIFERFYRVDKARSRKTGGSGLGLSIAKAIINNHHGKLEVSSVLGVGSIFTVKLPLIH